MDSMFTTNFSAIDWGIVGLYLVLAVSVGIVVNRYIHSVSDYLVGGRQSGRRSTWPPTLGPAWVW
jgi:Na+/proline symporter